MSGARWAKVTKASRAQLLPVERASKVTGLGALNVGQLNPELFFVYTDTGTAVTQRSPVGCVGGGYHAMS